MLQKVNCPDFQMSRIIHFKWVKARSKPVSNIITKKGVYKARNSHRISTGSPPTTESPKIHSLTLQMVWRSKMTSYDYNPSIRSRPKMYQKCLLFLTPLFFSFPTCFILLNPTSNTLYPPHKHSSSPHIIHLPLTQRRLKRIKKAGQQVKGNLLWRGRRFVNSFSFSFFSLFIKTHPYLQTPCLSSSVLSTLHSAPDSWDNDTTPFII